MKRKSLKLSFEYMDTPERRVLSLDADGVPCVPVLGFDAYRRQWRAAPIHVHDECVEISLCLRGNLEFEMGGKRYPFRPGNAIRAHGVSPWLSMRMNDNHNANEPKAWLHSKFWVEHPEYRKQGGFNYSIPAVQDYHFAFIEEMLARYDVDGFECDWMRWPIPQDPAALTAFMRRARTAVDAAAKRRGHPILLGVRVASRPAAALAKGMAVAAWTREKLVDWVVPANFFGSVDFDIPLGAWQKIVADAGSSALVVPCLDTGVITQDPTTKRRSPRRMLTLAEYCGWAGRMYERGAPGVYFFNLFTYFEAAYHVTDTTPWDFIITHGLTPESIKGRPASIPANWWYEP